MGGEYLADDAYADYDAIIGHRYCRRALLIRRPKPPQADRRAEAEAAYIDISQVDVMVSSLRLPIRCACDIRPLREANGRH